MSSGACRGRADWTPLAALAAAGLLAAGCSDGGPWERLRIAEHWSREAAAVCQQWRRAGEPDATDEDCLVEGGTVSIGPAADGRVLVAHAPTSGDLYVTRVSVGAGRLEVLSSWKVENGVAVSPAQDSVLPGKLAMAWGAPGGDTAELWYVQPWTWELACCEVHGGDGTPRVSRFGVPWRQPGLQGRDLTATEIDLACAPTSGTLYLVRAHRNGGSGPTVLFRWAAAEQQAEALWTVGASYMPEPRLLPSVDGDVHVFSSLFSSSAPETIAEMRRGWDAPVVRVAQGMYMMGYVLVGDAAGRAHIIYEDHSFSGGASLKHAYEAEDAWHIEVVDQVGAAGVDLKREPVRADLRPAACFGADGALHVSYFDFAADAVKYATNGSGDWTSQVVARARAVSSTDVATADGRVFVAYGDVARRGVYLAVADVAQWPRSSTPAKAQQAPAQGNGGAVVRPAGGMRRRVARVGGRKP